MRMQIISSFSYDVLHQIKPNYVWRHHFRKPKLKNCHCSTQFILKTTNSTKSINLAIYQKQLRLVKTIFILLLPHKISHVFYKIAIKQKRKTDLTGNF